MHIKKIHLIDSDHIFAGAMIKSLNERGDFHISHFFNYDEAQSTLENENPDLVMIEHHLEGTKGLDIIPLIRRSLPDTDIIMISNQNDISVVEQSFEQGVKKYFRKDALLIDHIEGYIKEKSSVSNPGWKNLLM